MQQIDRTKAGGGRLFYFDIIRAAACLMVVMIHVSGCFLVNADGKLDLLAHVFNSLSRPGVPLFVMISGALMLDEQYVFTKEKLIGHILKMVWFYLFWSAGYCFVFYVGGGLIDGEPVKLAEVIWRIVCGHGHLWFVPMIICLYALVPLLRLWVSRQNRRYVEYFMLLSAVFAFVIPQAAQLLACIDPAFVRIWELINNFYMNYPIGYTPYFVLGWYLRNQELCNRKILYALGIAGIAVTVLGTFCTFEQAGERIFYDPFSLNVLLYTILIFVGCKSRFGAKQYADTLPGRSIKLIARCSLGIYALHLAFIGVMLRLFGSVSSVIAVPVIFVLAFAGSLMGSLVMGKIPFLRKFV